MFSLVRILLYALGLGELLVEFTIEFLLAYKKCGMLEIFTTQSGKLLHLGTHIQCKESKGSPVKQNMEALIPCFCFASKMGTQRTALALRVWVL